MIKGTVGYCSIFKHIVWASALFGIIWCLTQMHRNYYADPRVGAMEDCTRGFPEAERQVACAKAIFGKDDEKN